MSVAELWELLESSPDGLPTEEAQARIQQYGKNALQASKGKSIVALILEQFEDRLVQILLGVALLSGIFSYLEVRQDRKSTRLNSSHVD